MQFEVALLAQRVCPDAVDYQSDLLAHDSTRLPTHPVAHCCMLRWTKREDFWGCQTAKRGWGFGFGCTTSVMLVLRDCSSGGCSRKAWGASNLKIAGPSYDCLESSDKDLTMVD